MSEENLEIIRRGYEALEQGGIESLLKFCSADVEYRTRPDLPDARTYRGHDGVRALAAEWRRIFPDLHFEPVELIDAGDRVVALMRISGRGEASGVETGNTYGAVYWVRNEQVWRIADYPTLEDALEAAGLSE